MTNRLTPQLRWFLTQLRPISRAHLTERLVGHDQLMQRGGLYAHQYKTGPLSEGNLSVHSGSFESASPS